MSDPFVKDPSSRLDYQVDWSDWLSEDTISASAWTVPDGLTVFSESASDTVATVWLEGGTASAEYTVTNQITTAGGRIDQRSLKIVVRER